MSKLKVINLIAGPGAGKSTTRAGLFNLMKTEAENCEETTEFAKDVTWDETQVLLSDALYVLANQNRRLTRLQGKVEWAISDSPLILSIHYVTPEYLPKTFRELVLELWNTYDNYNVVIERVKPYNPIGRNQTADEAKKIDSDILHILELYDIPFLSVPGDKQAPETIYKMIKNNAWDTII